MLSIAPYASLRWSVCQMPAACVCCAIWISVVMSKPITSWLRSEKLHSAASAHANKHHRRHVPRESRFALSRQTSSVATMRHGRDAGHERPLSVGEEQRAGGRNRRQCER